MMSLKFTVQARSNKIDIFLNSNSEAVLLSAKPVEFKIGNGLSTNPDRALVSLPIRDARELAKKLLRAAGEEGS